ncbi:non-specific lipid transfer protein GPI-anchored 9-like isoform X2 [Tasmannia lanceolata]|uniref:non-specific lipid transfer protein GPI-anchored 9-like isoform X2 n=1 Tax=Tasmannia lanceolata TaxID=3420 RepID=UPI004062FCB6
MESKLLLLGILLCSWAFVGFCQGDGGSGGTVSMPCVKKLLPCQPYLHSSAMPPPACCVPLKEMIQDDKKCLCDVLSNEAVLNSLNITKDQAMGLPKKCGDNASASDCGKNNGTATPPSIPTPPAPSSSSTNSSSGNDKSLANGFSMRKSAIVALTLIGCMSIFISPF